MEVKINFKVNEPTTNGRIYPKEILKKAFDERFKHTVFITDSNDDGKLDGLDVNKIIGEAKGYKINEKNEILIDVKMYERGKKLFNNVDFNLTTSGLGSLDKKRTIKSDFIFSHFFVTM